MDLKMSHKEQTLDLFSLPCKGHIIKLTKTTKQRQDVAEKNDQSQKFHSTSNSVTLDKLSIRENHISLRLHGLQG